jgi:hypothetical protein
MFRGRSGRRGRASRGTDVQNPGGHPPWMVDGERVLFHAEPLPQRIHGQDQVSFGMCRFTTPLLFGHEGPTASPFLHFKMTWDAIWTINPPEANLYHEVEWAEVEHMLVEGGGGRTTWKLQGSFVRGTFRNLQLEPRADLAQPLVDLLEDKGIPVRVPQPDSAPDRLPGPDDSPA